MDAEGDAHGFAGRRGKAYVVGFLDQPCKAASHAFIEDADRQWKVDHDHGVSLGAFRRSYGERAAHEMREFIGFLADLREEVHFCFIDGRAAEVFIALKHGFYHGSGFRIGHNTFSFSS